MDVVCKDGGKGVERMRGGGREEVGDGGIRGFQEGFGQGSGRQIEAFGGRGNR